MAEAWNKGPCKRLDELLEDADLSNVAVAEKLGVTDGTVSRWRSGDRVPNADTLASILELCGGSADHVLGLSALVAAKNDELQLALAQVASLAGRFATAQTRKAAGQATAKTQPGKPKPGA